MSSTPKQKQEFQQARKAIQEPSNSSKKNSPFLLPKPIKLTEQLSPSFSLFDDFTFSLSPPNAHEGQGWTPSDQFKLGTATQSSYLTDTRIDEMTPRFSNLSLQREGARFPELGQRRKIGPIIPPNPTFQPVVWPEKGFPFHQTGPSNVVPNSLQCACTPVCVIPQQMPYELEKQAFLCNQHRCMPTSCAGCIEEFANSNLHRMPEPCSLPCCKPTQHVRIVSQEDVYQQLPEPYQSPASLKGRKKLTSGRSRKAVVKVNQRRRNHSENREIPEQQIFVSNKPAEQIPKGARPILPARK
ncbi:uncharacterized protein LOC117170928 [Belonocnema kinseyi]|uniref:uncharacterized protein LOC117170928 n=1 Tax=Belonocnema kinseyi TaxID=2817044 RepID=UPI00143DCA86|nr:uncharacterized protein LOC117170928 [Belonocnema kinseyi]